MSKNTIITLIYHRHKLLHFIFMELASNYSVEHNFPNCMTHLANIKYVTRFLTLMKVP
jgi:hypothetical protein